jgi:flavin reductase (DIM6/NTAB) family NADH-FMN oxidoreductase RutF
MEHAAGTDTLQALNSLPSGTFLLTAKFDDRRSGMLVHWVQPCAEEPALVAVAARKGHSIEPLIRDSRSFAICRIDMGDRLLFRKFASHQPPDEEGDPFDSIEVESLVTGSPVLSRATAVLDCVVVRHFDLEADHELFVGQVLAGWVRNEGSGGYGDAGK